jgi:hypothetical protein
VLLVGAAAFGSAGLVTGPIEVSHSSWPKALAPACKPNQFSVTLPREGPKTAGVIMQGSVYAVWLLNRGPTCALRGYPRLNLAGPKPSQYLNFVQTDSSGTPMGRFADVRWDVKHGARAAALIAVGRGNTRATCASWFYIRPLPASREVRLKVPSWIGICPGSYPSHQLVVSPYHPASVGPFSTWPG